MAGGAASCGLERFPRLRLGKWLFAVQPRNPSLKGKCQIGAPCTSPDQRETWLTSA